jgi:hypothetical protein
MRNYRRNSPEAAARIVALATLSDGNVCQTELDALQLAGLYEKLGVTPAQWQKVMQNLCEDLLAGAATHWSGTCAVDPDTMRSLMNEIDDPVMQVEVVELCAAVIDADEHLSDGECIVLEAAAEHWKLLPSRRDAFALV